MASRLGYGLMLIYILIALLIFLGYLYDSLHMAENPLQEEENHG
jgi:hypothetical protein